MKRSPFVLLAALCGLASPPALAATPHPTAADADKDGAFTATVDVNGDAVKDHLDIQVRKSQYDCDDAHATVSPRLTEVVGDGIDNDCSGADANWPAGVTDAIAARFIANSGAKSGVILIAEYDACKAAAECEIDTVAGTFKITAAAQDTHVFADIKVNGSAVLRNSGQKADGREVVTVEDFQHFRGGSASGSGPSKATRAKEAVAATTPLVAAETEARLAADATHDQRLSVIETGNAGRDGEINRLADVDAALEGRLADSEDAIQAEVTRAKAAEAEAIRIAQAARASANSANDTAGSAASLAISAASHGALFEGYALGGLSFGQQVNDDGNVARNPILGGGGAGLNVGVDGFGYRANAFAQVSFGSDGSDGPANMWDAGGEFLWALPSSDVHFGIQGGYAQRSSLVDALQTNVLGRLPNIGPSLAIPFAQGKGGQHGVFLIRSGFGPEFIGSSGDVVSSATRFGGFVSIGIGGGVGALKR